MAQYRWDPLEYADMHGVDQKAGAKLALADRDKQARAWRKEGFEVKCWTLTGQLRKYSGLGQPDGRIRNVYYITVT